jgi:hypothetical protein
MSISINNHGRLGNVLFQNITASILAKKFNLKVLKYADSNEHQKIGLNYFNGDIEYSEKMTVSDNNLLEILKTEKINMGLNIDGYFQLKDFVLEYKEDILSHFDLNYENVGNNDLLIHVRMGDASHLNAGLGYYTKAVENLNYNKGYIISEDKNTIVQNLIDKFNFEYYNASPIDTINLAKNFNNIVLSKGTFSWWIGFLSKATNIIYPSGGSVWHGDIFVFENWKSISMP